MEIGEKINFLKEFPLFCELTAEEVENIARGTHELNFPAGEVLIEQDSEGGTTFFILEGGVKVYRLDENGDMITLAVLGPKDVIGEMSLIDNEPRSANVETIKDTKVMGLDKSGFTRILNTHPNIAMGLLRTLSARVRATNEKLEDILSKDLTERTQKTLKTLVKYFPNNEITLSQEELADIIGATRARVTEALNELQKEGKISLAHRRITLL